MKYQPIIGLEVHVELKTKSKMFCGCSADYFGKAPNTHVCPVCLGLPGALPVPNKTAINWCIMIGLALNCKIPNFSKFDRKNYFYPDLPKGYQISQYDAPFAVNGYIKLSTGKKIRIRRVHMEEDTGKLIHQQDSTLIDFNRSGVPLVEIVTEPDFRDSTDVVLYLKKIQQIVRYLGVSNAEFEKGDMRMEPNISLRKSGDQKLPKYKVEIKNINSFRFVLRAITQEQIRQEEILEKGEIPHQETRGWDETKQKTVPQRSKEEAHDYRYFPEPDIPPITFSESDIASINCDIPELPEKKLQRFTSIYAIPKYDAEILIRDRKLAEYFEQAVSDGKKLSIKPKQIANTIINKKIDVTTILPAELIKTIISSSETTTINDTELEQAIKKMIHENQQAVEDYKKGKVQVIGFLLGKVKQVFPRADIQKIKTALEKELS